MTDPEQVVEANLKFYFALESLDVDLMDEVWATDASAICVHPNWSTDEIVVLPRSFRITANASPQFHKRGNASPSGTLTIWDSHSKSKQVIVNITGRVRVN